MDQRNTNEMYINHLTMTFSGRYAHLESHFQNNLYAKYLRPFRIGIVIAMALFGVFGLYDAVQVPAKKELMWAIRWGFIVPLLLLCLAISYTQYFRRYLELIHAVGICLIGFSLVTMILIAQMQGCYTYTNGMVQLLFFVHAFLKNRYKWRAPITWCIIFVYIGMAISTGITPIPVLRTDIFNLACINTIGMTVAYLLEFRSRRNFFLSRQLESKKRRLAIANQFLEERVNKRTAALRRTNQLLKDEIQERKAAESALRESERRFRRMVDNVSDHMCVHDLNGNILDANRQMIAGLGYRLSELTNMNFKELIIPEQHFDFDHYLNNIRREGRAMGKMTLLTKEGDQLQVEYSNAMAEHTSGNRVIYSLSRDMTQHQRTQKALAESQASFQNIFEIAAAGMMIVDAQTRKVVEVNPAAADMVGDKIDHIKGLAIDDLIRLPNHEGSDDMVSFHPIECELTTRQHTQLPILKSTKGTALNGHPHWIVSFVNIQKIKEAEEAKRTMEMRLHQAQHLQSIGTLAGGIAHDFNNILFGMMGFTELALDDAREESLQAANLKEILQGGRRAREIIRQILTFCRQDQAEKRPLRPAPLIKEALKLLRASIPTTVDIRGNFKDQTGIIQANPTQVHQVIMNLCTNAAQAMSTQGGQLIVELDNITIKADKVTAHGKIPKGDYVRIRVSDNGIGMPPDIVNRIFEPFFTTKPQGEGTGMGLSATLGIVQTHGGAIQVWSQPNKGSRFDVLLPSIASEKISLDKDTSTLLKGDEQILLVDDEKLRARV